MKSKISAVFLATLAAFCVLPAAPGLASSPTKPDLSIAAQLTTRTHFPDQLIPTRATTPRENAALLSALANYERRVRDDDFSDLVAFLKTHPHSPWRVALLTNLGLLYEHYGYFTRAIAAWDEVWREGKELRGPYAKALVDEAVGKLVLLEAQLGHTNRVARLLDEIDLRPVSGAATSFVQTAREMLWVIRNDPKHLYLCGPNALATLMVAQGATAKQLSFIWKLHADVKGMSLAELAQLATQEKQPFVAVFRRSGEAVPVPSIVHWKIGHYAAITDQENGRYRVVDPVLGRQARWLTKAALNAEGSGYFLAPKKEAKAAGWRPVTAAEGGKVWGAGPTNGPPPWDPGPPADPPPNSAGMSQYNISELQVGVILTDNPVGYVPPIGPSAELMFTYNQYEASQPAVFGFFNVGPKWTFNFLTHIVDDPNNPGSSVSRYRTAGGAWFYNGYNSATGAFVQDDHDASILVLESNSPVTYRRYLKDGTVEVYAKSDGATSYPRRVFLEKIIDPQGNSLTLNYGTVSGHVVLQSLTDSAGGQTTFTYGSSLSPLLVTKITEPSGSFALLDYDSSGRLISMTDTVGRTSWYTYDSSSLINYLTTPNGTTTFLYGGGGNSRFVEVVNPVGDHEREETLQPSPGPFSDPANLVPQGIIAPFNQYLTYRNSFHWNKDQYVLAGCSPTGGCNYNLARVTHFAHEVIDGNWQSITGHFVESIKYPFQNRTWYDYAGQQIPGCAGLGTACGGTYNMPLAIGRVLNDGTTQLTQCSYNSVGNLTGIIYPTGQTFNFIYAANGIGLVLVQQVTGTGPVTIAPRQSGIVLRAAQAACTVGSQQPLFAGTPGAPNCHGESVSALAQQYSALDAAAAALNYPSVENLQNAITTYCGHSG